MKFRRLFTKDVTYERVEPTSIQEIDLAQGEFGKHQVTYQTKEGKLAIIEVNVRYKANIDRATLHVHKENGEVRYGDLDLPIRSIL